MRFLAFAFSAVLLTFRANSSDLPDGFVSAADFIPGVVVDARYAGDENFMGRRVDGYYANTVLLTRQAAVALAGVQQQLAAGGMALKLFDGYRPQRAVDHFMAWTKDANDTINKPDYYPDLRKDQLVPGGYIAEKSGHTRGSTVDLTIVRLLDDGSYQELDMGSPWDFFGPISHPSSAAVPEQARVNRMLLRTLMMAAGYRPLEEEWWHFTLQDEPYPDTYFDFPVE